MSRSNSCRSTIFTVIVLGGFLNVAVADPPQSRQGAFEQADQKNEEAVIAARAHELLSRYRREKRETSLTARERPRVVRIRANSANAEATSEGDNSNYQRRFRDDRVIRQYDAPLRAVQFYGGGYGRYETFRGQPVTDPFVGRNEYLRRLSRQQYNADDMAQREQRILRNQDRAVEAGLSHLSVGEYQKAVVAFRLAAQLDQGDPACRIHLGHALMALDQYERGGAEVRRALSLQPKLVMIPFDLAGHDVSDDAFDQHVSRMKATLETRRGSGDEYFLQGYVAFSRGEYDEAATAFDAAARVGRHDDALSAFLNLVRDVGGRPQVSQVVESPARPTVSAASRP
ncbi:MAG: tetratricopeptide repeat protein [Phycisphaerae bacterium]